jgi:hypothetical protein
MAKQTRTTLEQMTAPGIFDMFEPLRRINRMQEQADRILGNDAIRKMNSAMTGPNLVRDLSPIVDTKVLDMFKDSTARQLGLGVQKPLLEDTMRKLGVGAGLTEAFKKADLYGALPLDDMLGQIKGLPGSIVIGSTVLPPDLPERLGLTAKSRPALDQLFDNAHFEPGRLLDQFKGYDTKALMLGREGTLAALRRPTIEWDPGGFFAFSDLVAPVDANGELTPAAFPPDLIEEDPLSAEFEVDAIVAEHQTGAQIFLVLRSPIAAERMQSARQRLQEGDTEALAQCVTSCRRALHALADTVYPAREGAVKDRKGIERKVDAEAFKNRLMIFLDDAIDSAKPRPLALATIDKVAGHLDALVDQLNKGVHVDVVRAEATEAYVETWAVIARVARIYSDE